MTSTQWLERRGLLETLSVSEAAAVALAPAQGPALAASARVEAAPTPLPPPPDSSVPDVPASGFWGLAFLPVVAALLRELL